MSVPRVSGVPEPRLSCENVEDQGGQSRDSGPYRVPSASFISPGHAGRAAGYDAGSGAGLNSTPALMIAVSLICILLPHVSYIRKQDQKRDKKGKVVRDERTKDLRVSIAGRTAAPLMTMLYTSLLGWFYVNGEAG
ncbi:hypothetical protein GCM10023074_62460 [Microbispora amethystogenes]|uniref:Uncharacterized protein n=1 Tax=Microbispora amethystogenes TaxID=1427754 RepID=A0ABQ4FP04_9ACTN|nr:hypothetical protein Mam01_67000 [Microbispora amethystogenes]